MQNSITVSPQYKEYKDLYEQLKEELVKLIADRDDLLGVVKVNLEADYQLKIGTKQYDVFCMKVAALRLKRKMELFQAAINKQEQCSITDVEVQLDVEFKQWQKQAQELYEKIKDAEYYKQLPGLSRQEAIELKKLYRDLAKKYHPDVNPDEPEKAKNLWLRISEAYHKSDLQEMKTLALLAEDIDKGAKELSTMEKLQKECASLKEKIQDLIDASAKMHSEFPFNLAEKLQDDSWVQEQNAMNDSEMLKWRQAKDQYEEKVVELEYLINKPVMH
jgi:hypothetical protein